MNELKNQLEGSLAPHFASSHCCWIWFIWAFSDSVCVLSIFFLLGWFWNRNERIRYGLCVLRVCVLYILILAIHCWKFSIGLCIWMHLHLFAKQRYVFFFIVWIKARRRWKNYAQKRRTLHPSTLLFVRLFMLYNMSAYVMLLTIKHPHLHKRNEIDVERERVSPSPYDDGCFYLLKLYGKDVGWWTNEWLLFSSARTTCVFSDVHFWNLEKSHKQVGPFTLAHTHMFRLWMYFVVFNVFLSTIHIPSTFTNVHNENDARKKESTNVIYLETKSAMLFLSPRLVCTHRISSKPL